MLLVLGTGGPTHDSRGNQLPHGAICYRVPLRFIGGGADRRWQDPWMALWFSRSSSFLLPTSLESKSNGDARENPKCYLLPGCLILNDRKLVFIKLLISIRYLLENSSHKTASIYLSRLASRIRLVGERPCRKATN